MENETEDPDDINEIIETIKKMPVNYELNRLLQYFKMPRLARYMACRLEDELKEYPKYFKMGLPKEEIQCEFSCRGSMKMISK